MTVLADELTLVAYLEFRKVGDPIEALLPVDQLQLLALVPAI